MCRGLRRQSQCSRKGISSNVQSWETEIWERTYVARCQMAGLVLMVGAWGPAMPLGEHGRSDKYIGVQRIPGMYDVVNYAVCCVTLLSGCVRLRCRLCRG